MLTKLNYLDDTVKNMPGNNFFNVTPENSIFRHMICFSGKVNFVYID